MRSRGIRTRTLKPCCATSVNPRASEAGGEAAGFDPASASARPYERSGEARGGVGVSETGGGGVARAGIGVIKTGCDGAGFEPASA